MAYSQADLENVQAALLKLATGKRVVSVTMEGKTIEYSRADLDKLESLRNNIASEINRISKKSSCMLVKTSKGL
jgi:hypothetical protein